LIRGPLQAENLSPQMASLFFSLRIVAEGPLYYFPAPFFSDRFTLADEGRLCFYRSTSPPRLFLSCFSVHPPAPLSPSSFRCCPRFFTPSRDGEKLGLSWAFLSNPPPFVFSCACLVPSFFPYECRGGMQGEVLGLQPILQHFASSRRVLFPDFNISCDLPQFFFERT